MSPTVTSLGPVPISQGPNTASPNKTMKSSLGLGLRLNPQSLHMSEREAADLSRSLADVSLAALASPLEDDDLLRKILLRLPPQPSSLPRVSAVCKHWHCLVTDAKFLCSFRAHHRKPPVLGFIQHSRHGIVFTPVLDPPDRIPSVRFSLGRFSSGRNCYVLDCRHGHVLVKDCVIGDVVVCDPFTGEQCRVAIPPEFKSCYFNAAVLCAAGHGGCHSSPFKVVLMSIFREDNRPTVCVYSSESDIWDNIISTEAPYQLGGDTDIPATLVGNALCWLSRRDHILQFDLDGQIIAVITGPPITNDILCQNHRIIPAEDGALGFVALSFPHFEMWRRNVNGHGVATWVLWKTVEMLTILGFTSPTEGVFGRLLGYDEDNGVIFLYVEVGVYMVQLMSMQFRKLYETYNRDDYHPFTCFFTPGMGIAGSRYIR